MIKNVGAMFWGDPDLENVGLSGIRVNQRRLSNSQIATAYDKARDIAQLLDRYGYDVDRRAPLPA